MISMCPLVTINFLESEIALDQILVEKGDMYWSIVLILYMSILYWKLKPT